MCQEGEVHQSYIKQMQKLTATHHIKDALLLLIRTFLQVTRAVFIWNASLVDAVDVKEDANYS